MVFQQQEMDEEQCFKNGEDKGNVVEEYYCRDGKNREMLLKNIFYFMRKMLLKNYGVMRNDGNVTGGWGNELWMD